MATKQSWSMLPEIVSDPTIQGGEPTIGGTRVPVRSVVLLLQTGATPREIYAALPALPAGGVEAARTYNRTHAVEIDQRIDEIERANAS